MSKQNTPDLFWKRVNKLADDKCWNWRGGVNTSGYGVLKYKGETVTAHRLAFYLTHGEIPIISPMTFIGKQFILHSCDNPRCCNPAHLRRGTHSENMHDAHLRKRVHHSRGANHSMSCLSESDYSNILIAYRDSNITQKELAAKYKVSKSTIGNVLKRIALQAKSVNMTALLTELEAA